MAPRPESIEAISERLKLLRLVTGETQVQFTVRLGITQPRWNNMEWGSYPLSKDVALAIVRKILGLAVSWEYLRSVGQTSAGA
jgi:hypothetical protein